MKFNIFSWLGIPKILMNVMSCHDFSKPTTSKVIITYHKALVLYHLTREFRIVKKVKCVFYNSSERVLRKTNTSPLHEKDRLLTCKSAVPSIEKTFNQNLNFRNVYDKFLSSWFDERYVKLITEQFHFFVKHRIDELEHTSLSTEWTQNMDTAAYMEHLKNICP